MQATVDSDADLAHVGLTAGDIRQVFCRDEDIDHLAAMGRGREVVRRQLGAEQAFQVLTRRPTMNEQQARAHRIEHVLNNAVLL